jgi:hypothetical protein
MSENLADMLARSDIHLHYNNPGVHEIVVAGDVAVVWLTWTLMPQANGDNGKGHGHILSPARRKVVHRPIRRVHGSGEQAPSIVG